MNPILKGIKSVFPHAIKYPLWYILKSPQRSLGWQTLARDLHGIALRLFRMCFPKQKLKPISICTGVYNRSEMYTKAILESLKKVAHPDLIELSVYDCASVDAAALEATIRRVWQGRLVFTSEEKPFSRTYAFNRSIKQSTADLIFVCDADIGFPPDIVQHCNDYTGSRIVWFPIVFLKFNPAKLTHSNPSGVWDVYSGKGNLVCRRDALDKVGMLNEAFTQWGGEDTEWWTRFHAAGFTVIRARQKGMIHHWHQSLNPKWIHMND